MQSGVVILTLATLLGHAPDAKAGPGLAVALDLCTDTGLSIVERVDAFRAAGWARNGNLASSEEALAHALFLSRLDAGNAETWEDERDFSATIADRLRKQRGYETAHFLVFGSEQTMTVEPNGRGLATCLYTGQGHDLSAVADLLAPSKVLQAGPRRSIRGDFAGGTLVAHALSPEAASALRPPLKYTSTFTVVLDRTGGE